MTIIRLQQQNSHPNPTINMSYNQSWQQQDRWQQSSPASDYAMGGMAVYDHRTLPSTHAVSRSTMASQYSLPTTYAESPVTPMSASSYSSQAHFGGYQQPYQYAAPTTSYVDQTQLRHSQRPLAPPTPPLEDDRSLRYYQDRTVGTVGSTVRRSSSRSVSVVKSEASSESRLDIKTCTKQVKTDGKTLVNEFDKPIDKFLGLAKRIEAVLPIKNESAAATPESMASPATEESQDFGRPQMKKDKKCDYCPKMFAQNAQLTTHMRSHTGEKPYECLVCGQRVSQPGNLKSHMRRHTGEQRYECTECHVKFKANGSLKNHMKQKHDGEEKKSCPIAKCPKTFTTIGNMKVHINKYHEIELHEYMEMISRHDISQPFPEDVAELWATLIRIYKNSNCGIKGRGVESKEKKDFDKAYQEQYKRHQQAQEQQQRLAIPMSPDSASTIPDHRTFYDQNAQQHYAMRSSSAQHQSSYMQQQPLPMQHSPQVYHGLPQPTAYSMGWTPQPQYAYSAATSHV